jgi:hypothetical protein
MNQNFISIYLYIFAKKVKSRKTYGYIFLEFLSVFGWHAPAQIHPNADALGLASARTSHGWAWQYAKTRAC